MLIVLIGAALVKEIYMILFVTATAKVPEIFTFL